MAEEQNPQQPRRMPSIGEGIRTGIGLLSAFKEAIEETIQEALESGNVEPERAKEVMSGALHRAQAQETPVAPLPPPLVTPAAPAAATGGAETATRAELDALRAEVAELRRRVAALETAPRPPAPSSPAPNQGPAL